MKFTAIILFLLLSNCLESQSQTGKSNPLKDSATAKSSPLRYKQLPKDPVFFIDSVNVSRDDLNLYKPEEIAALSVYKDSSAVKLIGEQGMYGVIYIETIKFAKKRYWNYFRSKSAAYQQAVPAPGTDSMVVYILNNKVLDKNFAGSLASIDDNRFISLNVIGEKELTDTYNVAGKKVGILVTAKPTGKEER